MIDIFDRVCNHILELEAICIIERNDIFREKSTVKLFLIRKYQKQVIMKKELIDQKVPKAEQLNQIRLINSKNCKKKQ